jgi:DNA-directed RNA polymerase specialized sigma24 family protein
VNRDNQQHPADTDPRLGTSQAELEEKFAQLTRRRSKLTPEEAALLRKMFPVIRAANHKHVWNQLRRRRLSRHDADELYQEVFVALYIYILEHGFPDSVPGMLTSIIRGKVSNFGQAQKCLPPFEELPSSGSEKRSAPDLDHAMDLRELARYVLPQLSPEHREVVDKVFLNDVSHGDAAAQMGLTEGQLKARVVAARRAMLALAKRLLPPSQRKAL